MMKKNFHLMLVACAPTATDDIRIDLKIGRLWTW